MSTSTKQGPVKLSISQISSRDLVQILLRGSGNQSEMNGIQEFLSLSSLLLKALPVVLWAQLQSCLQPAGPSQGQKYPDSSSDTRQAQTHQTHHTIPAEQENALLPTPKILQNQDSEGKLAFFKTLLRDMAYL